MDQANQITAYATLAIAILSPISILIAFYAVKKQNRQAIKANNDFKLSLGADLAIRLEERFICKDFKAIRTKSAQSFLGQVESNDFEEVFDFFETVGLLLRLEAFNSEIVHNFFFHWINLYWTAGKGYISTKRQDTKTVWQDFEFAFQKTTEIEKIKDQNSKDLYLSGERLKEQLTEEIFKK